MVLKQSKDKKKDYFQSCAFEIEEEQHFQANKVTWTMEEKATVLEFYQCI